MSLPANRPPLPHLVVFQASGPGSVRPTDCEHGPRPCPETSCRYHLEHGGESCAIDVAEQGPQTIRRVAALLGVSHVRVLQIVRRAYIRARAKGLPRR